MELQEEQLQKLEQFLNGTMDRTTLEAFQHDINKTPQLQEFIHIYQELNDLEDDTTWNVTSKNSARLKDVLSILQNKNIQEFSEKIKKHRQEMITTPAATNRKTWLRPAIYSAIAACLALLVYVIIPKNETLATLYTTYSTWEELPSVLVKGDHNKVQKLAIEEAFNQKNFNKTILLTEQVIKGSQKVEANMLLYKGAAQLELNNFEAALKTYDTLIKSTSIDNHKGYWYKALTYLKKGDRIKTVIALKEVLKTTSNYKYLEAKALLKALD